MEDLMTFPFANITVSKTCGKYKVASAYVQYMYAIRWVNVGLLLGQRRRRWASINPALAQDILFSRHFWKSAPGELANSTVQRWLIEILKCHLQI